MNLNEGFKNLGNIVPVSEQFKQDPSMLGSVLIDKVMDVEMLQIRQPHNFVEGVLTFKTKQQRETELIDRVSEIEKSKEQIINTLLNEEYSGNAINFLHYALSKEDMRDDAKWEEETSPSERIRQFAENIVFENLPVFEKYIESTAPGNTKQTFGILEKIVQINQGKIFEAISESGSEKSGEIFNKFDQVRNTGEVPDDFKDDFLKLPGSKNYLAVLEFLKKQAPVINSKISEGLEGAPKMNDIIHEYVPGFELALKYLPINQAKELGLNIGKLFKVQDNHNRGVLDIFIADYAAEINRGDGQVTSKFSHDRASELQIGAKIFATAGYQYKEIGPVWFNSTSRENNRDMMIRNLCSLHALESERPGSAKYLTDNFGIVCFSRYPIEALIKQYDDRDETNSPFGIYATARTDHNGSMYTFNKQDKIEILSSKAQLNDYALKIIEVDNTVDAAKKIINLTKKLNKKVSFMFVNAHGDAESMSLGKFNSFRSDLNIDDISKPGTKKFFQYFEEGATLVLSSCLTGSEKGIAEEIAKTSGMTVIASGQFTRGINKLEIEKYKNNGLKFDVTFYTDKKNKSNVIFNEKK